MKVAYIYNIYLFLLYIKEFYMRIASALSLLSFGVTREAKGMLSTFAIQVLMKRLMIRTFIPLIVA